MSATLRTSSIRDRGRLTGRYSTTDIATLGSGDALAATWTAAVAAIGGTLTASTPALVLGLANALAAFSGFHKILYLLPLCGGNLAAARVPLIDRVAGGNAINVGMTDADFSQASGLTGNGSSKRFDLSLRSGTIMASAGGIGLLYGLRTFSGRSPNLPFTSYHNNGHVCFGMVLYPTLEEFVSSGSAPAPKPLKALYTSTSTQSASDYYGQDKDGNGALEFYRNGAVLSATAETGATYAAPELPIGLLGCQNGAAGWWSADRVGSAVITNGQLTAAEVAALHVILQDYLYTPTGR